MWLVYVIVGIGLLLLVLPKIQKDPIDQLKKRGYRVLENASLHGHRIDYLIISENGIHLVKKCVFRKRNTYLEGDELERTWTYYEPYVANPIVPARDIDEGPPANANQISINNPVIEIEALVKRLKQEPIVNEIPIYSIILLVPEIKGVRIIRKQDSKVNIVFSNQLVKSIFKHNNRVLSTVEMRDLSGRLQELLEL